MAGPATQYHGPDKIYAMKYAGATWGTGVDTSAASMGLGPYYRGGLKPMQLEHTMLPAVGRTMGAYPLRGRYADTAQAWQMALDHTIAAKCLAAFFGQDSSPAVADTTAYVHTLALQIRAAHYLTFACFEGSGLATWELPTVAVTGFDVDFNPGANPIMAAFSGLASHCLTSTNRDVVGGATTTLNRPFSTAGLGSATVPTLDDWCDFSNLVFRINAFSGGALSSSEELNVGSVKVSMQRPFEADHLTKNSTDGTLFARGPRQPRGTAELTGTLEVHWPNFDSQNDDFVGQLLDIIRLGTDAEFKVDLACTSPVLAGATNTYYKHAMDLPKLFLMSGPQEADVVEGGKPVTLVFGMMQAASAPTGMSVTLPTWYVTNQRSTSLLA